MTRSEQLTRGFAALLDLYDIEDESIKVCEVLILE